MPLWLYYFHKPGPLAQFLAVVLTAVWRRLAIRRKLSYSSRKFHEEIPSSSGQLLDSQCNTVLQIWVVHRRNEIRLSSHPYRAVARRSRPLGCQACKTCLKECPMTANADTDDTCVLFTNTSFAYVKKGDVITRFTDSAICKLEQPPHLHTAEQLWIIVRYITVCYRWLYRRGVLELKLIHPFRWGLVKTAPSSYLVEKRDNWF